jgi:hypothetical protein
MSRLALVAALAWLVIAVVTAPFMIGTGSFVVHWNAAGRPDGTMPGTAAWAVTCGVGSVGALLAMVARRTRRTVWLKLAGLFAAALFTGLGVLIVLANSGSAEPALPVVLLVLVILLAILTPVTAFARGPARPPAGEVRWQGRCRSRFAAPAAAGFLVVAVLVGVLVHVVAGIVLAAGGLCVLALVEIRVRVTPFAVRITYGGPLRWPSTTVDLRGVRAVEVIDVDPGRHGGWGYRGSLRFLRHAAINLRRGPGLRLTLSNGAWFVLTVEDAKGAAETIRQLISDH